MNKSTFTIRRRYDRVAVIYDLLESPMESMGMGSWRRDLCQQARGEVLEIGVGTGKNLGFYPRGTRIIGIDISPKMLAQARRRAEKNGIKAELMVMDTQNLLFPDNTFDTVLATCVFCSVPDPVQGLKEIARVCKPDGQVLLMEHVRSKHRVLGALMDILNPITLGAWGANINRNTVTNILAADLDIIEEDNLSRDIVKRIKARPRQSGYEHSVKEE